METVLGNKSEFAIQVMSEPDLKPPSAVWGRMCLWVKGIQLGDFDDSHCGLYQCIHHLNEVLEILDELWSESFSNKSDKEIFNILKNAWLKPDSNDFGVSNGNGKYHKFNISYGFAEMFDSEGMFFLLNLPNGSVKLLYEANEIKSFILNKQSFINAVTEFNSWYVHQENILDSKNA